MEHQEQIVNKRLVALLLLTQHLANSKSELLAAESMVSLLIELES